jgi:hypothetical protein
MIGKMGGDGQAPLQSLEAYGPLRSAAVLSAGLLATDLEDARFRYDSTHRCRGYQR